MKRREEKEEKRAGKKESREGEGRELIISILLLVGWLHNSF